MRNIFKPASAEPPDWRARVAVVVGALLFTAMATVGISRAVAEKVSPSDHVIEIEAMKFQPAALRVRVGDRVRFRNADLVPHTVTAKAAGGFDSGAVKPGESWTLVAKDAGSFGYTCAFHPMMGGELQVEPP
jgi:plastocyanin